MRPQTWHAKAREMRNAGEKILYISIILGKGYTTVQRFLNPPPARTPERRERENIAKRALYHALKNDPDQIAATKAKRKVRWRKEKDNPEYRLKVNARSRKYYADHREQQMAKQRRRRARQRAAKMAVLYVQKDQSHGQGASL